MHEGWMRKLKVKWSCYRPGVAQRVGRSIALLFHDCGTRRGWVVSSTPWPNFTLGKEPVPILQEVGWAPGPVWTGRKSRPHRDSILDRPARTQSLYWLSYPARKLSAVHVWHIPLLCVQWKTPDEGQRNFPKHAEFYSRNKFEKLMHLVGLVIGIVLKLGVQCIELILLYPVRDD